MLNDSEKEIIKLMKNKNADSELIVMTILYIRQENNNDETRQKIINYIKRTTNIDEEKIINLIDTK